MRRMDPNVGNQQGLENVFLRAIVLHAFFGIQEVAIASLLRDENRSKGLNRKTL